MPNNTKTATDSAVVTNTALDEALVAATSDLENSIKTLNEIANNTIELGKKIDSSTKKEYITAIENAIEDTQEYIEASHDAAIEDIEILSADGNDSTGLTSTVESVHMQLDKQATESGDELLFCVEGALEDSIITKGEQVEIDEILQQFSTLIVPEEETHEVTEVAVDSSVVVSQSLDIMWKGMVSIFVVIILLTIIVSLITKVVKDPKKED